MECSIKNADSRDASAISLIVEAALRTSNALDYSPDTIDRVVQSFSPSQILQFLSVRQVHVACVGDHVVATGSLDGDTVCSVFVDPSRQGQGIGRRLMATIEPVAVKSGIEGLRIPSSMTAQVFNELEMPHSWSDKIRTSGISKSVFSPYSKQR